MRVALSVTTAVLLASLSSVEAATISISASGDNDATLQSVTIDYDTNDGDPSTYSETISNWINVKVDEISAYTGSGTGAASWFLVPDVNPDFQPAPADRMAVLQDDKLGSNILGMRRLALTFNSPVTNRPGIDIVLFDLGVGDDVDITIGTITKSYTASQFDIVIDSSSGPTLDRYSKSVALDTLAKWTTEPADFPLYDTNPFGFAALGIDLDDFGVASGGTVTTMVIVDDSASLDPALVVGLVPEPSSFTLLLLGGLGCVLLRSRRRR